MRPKKYNQAITTSFKIEKDTKDLLDSLNISVGEAVHHGIMILIEVYISTHRDSVPQEVIEKFNKLRSEEMVEIKELLKIQERRADLVKNMLEKHQTSRKMIVYDNSIEQSVTIPETEFDPRWHEFKRWVPS